VTQGNTIATQTAANFTGTLLRRKHELGEKFVQLVFRDHDHDIVCVCTNLRTVALPIGQVYRVKGMFTHRGKQTIVFDPKIADPSQRGRTIRRTMLALVVLGCMTGVGGVAYTQYGSAKAHSIISSGQSVPSAVQVSTY